MMLRKSDIDSVEKIVSALKKGEVVIIPTDTVYGFSGIGGNIFFTDSKIREIKGRSETKPLIELISRPEDLFRYTDSAVPEALMSLWPGSLTIIVENNEWYKSMTGRATTAFRCPGDAWLRTVIGMVDFPVYSTSVNRSGCPVLEEISSIEKEFGNEVSLIVDDGDKKGALPSTLVVLSGAKVKVLRQGSVVIPESLLD